MQTLLPQLRLLRQFQRKITKKNLGREVTGNRRRPDLVVGGPYEQQHIQVKLQLLTNKQTISYKYHVTWFWQ